MNDFTKQEAEVCTMSEYETMFTCEAICPYCGWVNYDSWECSDECVEECPECNNSFDQERNVSITYSTKKIERKEGYE